MKLSPVSVCFWPLSSVLRSCLVTFCPDFIIVICGKVILVLCHYPHHNSALFKSFKNLIPRKQPSLTLTLDTFCFIQERRGLRLWKTITPNENLIIMFYIFYPSFYWWLIILLFPYRPCKHEIIFSMWRKLLRTNSSRFIYTVMAKHETTVLGWLKLEKCC